MKTLIVEFQVFTVKDTIQEIQNILNHDVKIIGIYRSNEENGEYAIKVEGHEDDLLYLEHDYK